MTEASGFADRFRRLEIPEERRRADWSFIEARLDLPAPLPLEDAPLLVLANGRAFVPADSAPAPGRALVLYDRAHALVEQEPPGAQEARWRASNAAALDRVGKRFFGSVPPSVLTEPKLVQEARALLDAGAPPRTADEDRAVPGELAALTPDGSVVARLLGWSRLLRLHGKLYDLRTLAEYASIFQKAIEPGFFTKLAALPATVAPEEALALVERSLDQVHAKARSPLRNKLLSSRVVLNGVTLLPIYREPAASLRDVIGALLERRLKAEVLAARA